jgi:hypothetical protein
LLLSVLALPRPPGGVVPVVEMSSLVLVDLRFARTGSETRCGEPTGDEEVV